MPLIPEESLASSRLVACLCKLRDWCMSLSGAEFKVQGCHKQQQQRQCLSSLHLPSPSLCRLSQGPVLPNFLAACPFGNLEQPRQGHSVWCSKPVQRGGRLYVTLGFKHGCMTSLTQSSAVQSDTAHSTWPTTPSPALQRGGGTEIPAT